jgi:hypothetical protein
LPDVALNRTLLRPGGRIDETAQSVQQILARRRVLERRVPLVGLSDPSFLPA